MNCQLSTEERIHPKCLLHKLTFLHYSFQIALRWLIHIINSVDKTKLPLAIKTATLGNVDSGQLIR